MAPAADVPPANVPPPFATPAVGEDARPDPAGRRPTVAVLKAQPYGPWLTRRQQGRAAGSLGPYSVDLLGQEGFEVRWSDRLHEAPWNRPLVDRALGWLGRRLPELRGASNALANRRLIRSCDITLGVFEDQGSFAAFARGARLPGLAPRRMALVVCWLAQVSAEASPAQMGGYRRALAGADLVICFSHNQLATFEGPLGVPRRRLLCVPFGIDEAFFASAETEDEEDIVLAVGGDRSRDHELLVEAVRGTGIATVIQSPRLAVADLPENVSWRQAPIDHVAYRELLGRARLVVVPTTAPAYPSGQTVLLEAMAAAKPVLTTDSVAIRDYISDGVNGLLVARGDAQGLRAALERLLSDEPLRRSLGAAARDSVATRFNQRAMWHTVAGELERLLPPERRPA